MAASTCSTSPPSAAGTAGELLDDDPLGEESLAARAEAVRLHARRLCLA